MLNFISFFKEYQGSFLEPSSTRGGLLLGLKYSGVSLVEIALKRRRVFLVGKQRINCFCFLRL